jgi:hypothetical protein
MCGWVCSHVNIESTENVMSSYQGSSQKIRFTLDPN